MPKNKLKKVAETKTFPNFLEFPEGMKGRWGKKFKNKNPIVLELGCGKAEYTLALARMFPQKNFIGIDKKGSRMWRGAKTALEDDIPNAYFLRIVIETLGDYFEEKEVDEIWITFPDPYPKNTTVKKRLTSPRFLEIYKKILRPGGKIHLKTDDTKLFDYSIETVKKEKMEIIEEIRDLYKIEPDPVLNIKTFYEKRHLEEGRKINYLCFSF